MATKKRIPRRRRGPKRDPEKWAEVQWVEQRAEEIGGYRRVARACADYVARHFPPEKQTAECIDSFRKRIKNAQDEWRIIDRLRKAARPAQLERIRASLAKTQKRL